jgi:O-6-methylguanine DNA methyltransferase
MLDCTEVTVVDGLTLRLVASDSGLSAIDLKYLISPRGGRPGTHPIAAEAARQLRAYFAGELREFDLPLDMHGTDFQLRVWRELERIPYGETRSYSQIAAAIGSPQAVRAVGAANGANPIPIIVPCHRVLGSGGTEGGFSGGQGLPTKRKLLALEGVVLL